VISRQDDAIDLYAKYQTAITYLKNDIHAQYESRIAKLQRSKEHDLKIFLPAFEKSLKQKIMAPKPKVANGVISGIVCSRDKNSAVIGGKIVQQGGSLGEVKVASIHPDHIEFERKSKRWKQKVGEPASSNW
jgi:hypothetical protein